VNTACKYSLSYVFKQIGAFVASRLLLLCDAKEGEFQA